MTNTKESDVGDTYLVSHATPGSKRRGASQSGQSSSLVTVSQASIDRALASIDYVRTGEASEASSERPDVASRGVLVSQVSLDSSFYNTDKSRRLVGQMSLEQENEGIERYVAVPLNNREHLLISNSGEQYVAAPVHPSGQYTVHPSGQYAVQHSTPYSATSSSQYSGIGQYQLTAPVTVHTPKSPDHQHYLPTSTSERLPPIGAASSSPGHTKTDKEDLYTAIYLSKE